MFEHCNRSINVEYKRLVTSCGLLVNDWDMTIIAGVLRNLAWLIHVHLIRELVVIPLYCSLLLTLYEILYVYIVVASNRFSLLLSSIIA